MNKILNCFQAQLLPNSFVLLSVSGGQDSMFLLFVLFVLQKQWKLQFSSIYCQHLWQKESLMCSLHLCQIHYWLQIELIIPVTIHNLKNEEAARNWRYKQLERLFFFKQAESIFTAHTNSDQLESFLFNLIRGCTGVTTITNKRFDFSSKYLCFSDKKNDLFQTNSNKTCKYCIRILRPLLCLNRYEIYQSLHLMQLPIWVDRTNFQMKYRRNRIRYQLLPAIRFYLNNRCDLSFVKYIQTLIGEFHFLDILVCQLIQNNVFYEKNTIIYNLNVFCFYPYVIKKRILVKSLCFINYSCIDFHLIQTILKIVSLQKVPSVFCLPRNLVLILYSNKLILCFKWVRWGLNP